MTEGHFPGRWIRSASLKVATGESLPRWTVDHAIYHLSLHLADAVPVAERARWREIRQDLSVLAQREKRTLTAAERELLKTAYGERIERYLAQGNGACLLREPEVAEAVADVLEHGNGQDYALHMWCVMPNHLHILAGFERAEEVLRNIDRWKRVSAHRINRLLSRKGPVWMRDAYTRIIRTADEYRRQLSYVWANPEKAGLTEGFFRRRYV